MKAIFLIRQLTERYIENVLHIVFLDLEQAYDRFLRRVLQWVLEKKKVFKYVAVIKDI